MPNLNICHLMGNTTRDPELRVTPKGTAVCQFSLAVNRKWKNDAGVASEEVTFIDCEAWGKAAETIAQYITKGRPLFVSGRIKNESWEDKTTKEKKSRMKVVVENFQFLGDKGGQGARPAAPRTAEENVDDGDVRY